MKQYQNKDYGGKWDNDKGYHHKYQKKKKVYYKQIIYPWKNQQKVIRST